MTADEQTYAFDNALAVQRERLELLGTLFDAGTIRQLEARGVEPGWRCLEVGAGGGSIAAWLCDRVGPDGGVLATDLDTRWVAELSQANLEIRVHDLVEDDLPQGEFDLVHMRMVLAWLREPSIGVQRLIAALKPGGSLLVEELDFVSAVPDPRMDAESRVLFERVVSAHNAILAERHAFDPFHGRRLAGDLEEAGLTEIDSEGRASTWRGGGPGSRTWQLTITQLRDAIVDAGLMDAADVDAAIALCADPRLSTMSPLMMAAWGRRAS